MGDRIKRTRHANPKYRGSGATLAKDVGVSRQQLSKWENDRAVPTGENLVGLAKALDVEPEWILNGGHGGLRVKEAGDEYRYGDVRPSVTHFLEDVSRAEELRRMYGVPGVGNQVAMVVAKAEKDRWGRDELMAALREIMAWAFAAESEIRSLNRANGGGDGDDDGGGAT